MSRSRFAVTATAATTVVGLVLSVAAPGVASARAPHHASHHASAKSAVVLRLASVRLAAGSVHGSRKVLVDATGLPVYVLSGDTTSHPKCASAACLHVWPAVTSSAKRMTLGAGVHGKLTVWRHKGMAQLVLNGHPLYRFYADRSGAAYGVGIKSFGGVWEALQASGSPMAQAKSHKGSSGSGW